MKNLKDLPKNIKALYDPHPLRFISLKQAKAWQDGELRVEQLPQPFIRRGGKLVRNPRYDNAPYERMLIIGAIAWKY